MTRLSSRRLATGSVTEDAGVNGAGNLVANGTLTVTDTDAGQAGFQAGTTHGAYGDLALNADGADLHRRERQPGHQALGNGDTLTETFTVKSTDGTSATVTITINGSNDSAVISSSGTTGSVNGTAMSTPLAIWWSMALCRSPIPMRVKLASKPAPPMVPMATWL